MSVYQKLQQARIKLQNTKLEKTGHNKFAGYYYFELGDFLPTVQNIFSEIGLCGVVSFTSELATLRVIDIEGNGEVSFTSPMGSAALKGCHEVQNIGAVETYQRRYLWVTAMEIVEHDALDVGSADDAQAKNQKAKVQAKPEQKSNGDPEPDAAVIAQFNAAKDVASLAAVMNGLSAEGKKLYVGHFNARMGELKKAA